MNKNKIVTLIFGNGPLRFPPEIYETLVHADLVIAADGGADHCAYLDIVPDYLIGDLDSIEPQLLKIHEKKNTQIRRYPRDKDATDLELALELAMQEGAIEISLLGVLGKRWDMSLANIMLAASKRFSDLQISLFSDDTILKILHPLRTNLFLNSQGKNISLLPLSADVLNVTLEGFAYPLKGENLPFGSTRGISNIIKDAQASAIHEAGVLLCIERWDNASHV
jgi:thiamine pyrophosphokinase